MATGAIRQYAQERMDKTYAMFLNDISGIRTGRVSASLLDGISVSYYGNKVKLNTVSSISVNGRTLLVSLWDASILGEVKSAIEASNMGFGMTCESSTVRLVVPELTNDVRKNLVKMLNKLAEESKVSVRNIRRDAIERLKSLQDNKEISEDDMHGVSAEIQKITDSFIKKIADAYTSKESEILG
ncbi:Ribosome-recycling factor [Anaplasma phagocytophilum]|uniref:Ribosome recycling factor n=4 Tax=Anaplasma phagocytophilum TaxID=948 RepID=A0A7H9DXT8_ANAPH|nr:ribosome recycling factor [Anaplasma phagocytophilum str. ApMUC09]KJV66519.1 ribosome recycling factor [Anaplasma phagocytophilum str. ApNP]QLL66408.1 ribosome recycling factor [Anaplasma phagocytophilum str. Norway variant1]SCV62325.1 Ribosome-recycling factor [Anaplasma phagocytophilum]SCV64027.1 Ribosome-recycling factor [Anaplasma phagocytophilum]